ncbi:MAG: EboA domain-containing protein [Myxococcales bacterium]|nr:EboA domain-containing protein [Myxococcales bacterium]
MKADAQEAAAALGELIRGRLDGPANDWLAGLAKDATVESVRLAMPDVARAVGQRPLVASFAERATAKLVGTCGPMQIGHWKTDEAVRTWLVARVAAATPTPFRTLFSLYDLGDTETRVATLRAVNFVEDADTASGIELILDAGRTYLDPLLEAAWCHNPFSAKHLSDEEYRKAVLKALFCNVPVDGFLDLDARADETLARSLHDYADEREAAGRAVPAAVWTVAALYPGPGLVARLIGRLEHPLPAERLTAARALANARDPRSLSFIDERAERESDETVRAALQAARARVVAGRG